MAARLRKGRHGDHGALARGPRWLQEAAGHQWKNAFPPQPGDWPGSEPEWAIYWAATQQLKLVDGPDFSYQSPIQGGRLQFGGLILDFVFYAAQIAVNVQGEYIHYGQGSLKVAFDQSERAMVAQTGFVLVFIDEDDAVREPVRMLRDALLGIDHSKGAVG